MRYEMRLIAKGLLAAVLWGLLPAQASCAPVDWDSTFQVANQMYERRSYDSAAMAYEALLADSAVSADLYYNLGNTYYRLRRIAPAILSYERALKYDPSHEDAEFNLSIAQGSIQDRLAEVEVLPLVRWFKRIPRWFTPRGWGYRALLFLVGVLVALLLFRFTTSRTVWQLSGVGGGIFLLFFILSLSFGLRAARLIKDSGHAIIMDNVVSIRSTPEVAGKDLFLLHSGAKVRILERLGAWYQIEIPDGHRGWINRESLAEI